VCEAGCVDWRNLPRKNSGFLLGVRCVQAKAARMHLQGMSIKSFTKTRLNNTNLNTEALMFGEGSFDRLQAHLTTGLETRMKLLILHQTEQIATRCPKPTLRGRVNTLLSWRKKGDY